MTKPFCRLWQRSKWRWYILTLFLLSGLALFTGRLGTSGIHAIMAAPIAIMQEASRYSDVTDCVTCEKKPSDHVVFIKVHKAASTTVMNVMLRYGLSRNLTIMLPRRYNCINELGTVSKRDVLPSITGKYDILCNHVIYNRTAIASFFPSDTKYVTILREPFEQFVSGFMFYRYVYPINYLKNFTSANPVHEFLSNPRKYEPANPMYSFTNNRMSLDLGYPDVSFKNMTYLDGFLKKLGKEFDLVMLAEYFDESVILLKRTLNWTLKDVLYISSNTFSKYKAKLNISVNDRLAYRQWAKADYALYQYFYDVFWRKVYDQGATFFQEVRTFRYLRKLMTDYCQQNRFIRSSVDLILQETDWSPDITITKNDCRVMLTAELNLIENMKRDYMFKFKDKVTRLLHKNSSWVYDYATKKLKHR
ncbi:hypothetical protein SNE40_008492 [Patella caerulea]|uniref:Uncharacterized protein n=2 Tax=Patella caerulea TaxID=87958 RepID=A0AAN8K1Y3_PATCE